MEWYYAKHGKQEGPVDLATLQGMLRSGQVAPTDLVWREGMAEWTAAQKVAELGAVPPPTQTAIPAPRQTPLAGPTPGGAAAPTPGPTPGYQQVQQAPVAHQHVPNYLVQSILVTLLCCQIFGIIAIVFAAQVDGKVARGDIGGAMNASNQAKLWSWLGFGCGLLVYVVIFIAAIAGEM